MVINSDLFSLSISQNSKSTGIIMRVFSPILNTRHIPHTQKILSETLPTVLSSLCFNEADLPFHTEVLQTEIGHLFEHILLEYLSFEKQKRNKKEVSYDGLTEWNWIEDTKGTFHITISAGRKDKEIFDTALEKSIRLLQHILTTIPLTN